MSPLRRALLAGALGCAVARAGNVQRGRALAFPRDHGAHPAAAVEWWYATGWLGRFESPTHGFQVTFFRVRTGLADDSSSRFAPRQLLLAHAALSDLKSRWHVHAEHIARWDGRQKDGPAFARIDDADVRIGRWRLRRQSSAPTRWLAHIEGELELEASLTPTQPLLLQGDSGFSRKGPDETQASHYYSEPQMDAQVRIAGDAPGRFRSGRAWLDHEWADSLLPTEAVGWDWVGINLADGGALMAFRLRRADGSTLWGGGTHRSAGGALRVFASADVRFVALDAPRWSSPATRASYPMRWTVSTPAGTIGVAALLDAQEVDARTTTAAVYWEGLAEALDERGQRIGLGYLEMTGYAQRLQLGG